MCDKTKSCIEEPVGCIAMQLCIRFSLLVNVKGLSYVQCESAGRDHGADTVCFHVRGPLHLVP